MKRIHQRNRRTSRLLVAAGSLFLFSLVSACQQQSTPDTRAADEQTVRDLDTQWSAAAGTKDLDKIVSYYAEDAVVLPPNASGATTKEAIRNVWKEMVSSPGFAISWKTTRAEVARSGDMAYSTGTYEATTNDASGSPTTEKGKYVEIWKKQADGSWKTVTDIWSSDLPATPAEKQ